LSRQPLSSVTSAFISTLMSLWFHTSPRPSLPASPYCISYEAFADPSPDPFSSRWYHHLFCHHWITEMQPLPVVRCTSSSISVDNELRCPAGVPIVEVQLHHSTHSNFIGWRRWRELTTSLLSLSTSVGRQQHCRILLTNFVSWRILRYNVNYILPHRHR